MSPISIKAAALLTRCNDIQEIIRPLRRSGVNVGCSLMMPKKRCQVLGVHDGNPKKTDNQWFFKTKTPKILGEYYEYWRPDKTGKNLILNRAYFHLYRVENEYEGSIKQIICIHCDPEEDENSNKYKLGPHLHVVAAEEPIPNPA